MSLTKRNPAYEKLLSEEDQIKLDQIHDNEVEQLQLDQNYDN